MRKVFVFVTFLGSFLVSSGLLLRPMLMDWTIRNQKEQVAKAKLAPVRSELYSPLGVTVLREREGFLPPDYFGGFMCFEGRVRIIYGTNRSADEIHEEYARGLTKSNWELDPGYKQAADFMAYRKDNEYHLIIDLLEVFTEPLKQDFKLIYSIFLTYVNPPYGMCKG